jgi:hypothetical protein
MNINLKFNVETYKLIIIGIIFILGLYFVYTYENVESFNTLGQHGPYSNSIQTNCPNILIQKGNNFFLYNSKRAKVPGVNPLRFNSLEDYVEFTEWQRSQGIRCPIMFVQESYDAQGNPVYKARPSPTNLQGGLPDLMPTDQVLPPASKLIDATRDDPPFNTNSYPAYDPQNQYIGLDTPLDKMFHEKSENVSPNPMDIKWGGIKYTQSLIDQGYYESDEIMVKSTQ